MTQQEIKNMPIETYIDLISEKAYAQADNPNNSESFFGEKYGHFDIHFRQAPKDLLDRILHENIEAASCFSSEDYAKELIANAIAYKARDIAKWMQKDVASYENYNEYMQYSFSLDFRSEVVGYGIDRNLKEIETTALRVVLNRDLDFYSSCGFFVTTAFPDLAREECLNHTGHSFKITTVIEVADFFKDALDKIACLYRYHKDAPEIIQYLPATSNNDCCVVMRYTSSDKLLDIYINNSNDINIREKSPRGRQKLDLPRFIIEYPKESKFLNEIINNLKALEQNQPLSINEKDFER